MKTFVDYKILQGDSNKLQTLVKQQLDQGWELHGSLLQSHGNGYFVQSVVLAGPTIEDSVITELHYVSGGDLAELTKGVSRRIQEKWKPLGGLVIANEGVNTIFYQAMVK